MAQSAREQADAEFLALLKADRLKERHSTWIQRSRTWDSQVTRRWKGLRVLGQGAYGVAGLFEWTGDFDPQIPKKVVVKQSGGNYWDNHMQAITGLKVESRFYAELNKAKSKHILRMYTSFHERPGTGTHCEWDPSPFTPDDKSTDFKHYGDNVARIYTEYCEKGDLRVLSKKEFRTPFSIPEEVAWRITECLAQGIHVLEHGHEDPPTEETNIPWDKPVVHLDLKPDNIFIANDDGSHNSPHHLGILKLADFGLSERVPHDPSNPEWLEHVTNRGTRHCMPPEQLYDTMHNRKVDQSTNVWGIGAVLNRLLTRDIIIPPDTFMYTYRPIPLFSSSAAILPPNLQTRTIETMSPSLIDDPLPQYSALFKQTILRCLAFNCDDRPTAKELLEITRSALQALEIANEGDARRVGALGGLPGMSIGTKLLGRTCDLGKNHIVSVDLWDEPESAGEEGTGGWSNSGTHVDAARTGVHTAVRSPIVWYNPSETGFYHWQRADTHADWDSLPMSQSK